MGEISLYEPLAGCDLPWVKTLPANFKVMKLKYVSDLYTGNSIKDDEKGNYTNREQAVPYIATKDIDAVFMTANYENGLYIKTDDTHFKFAESGSTLICIEGGSAGRKKVFLDQKVAFVNKLCCVAPKKDIDGKFLFYTLCSQGFEDEFRQNMTGLIGGVSVSALKNISVIVPPISIQKSIAHYLDEAYKDIDTSIEAAQRCIDDYKKLKMSVITKAVSKGIGRPYSAGSIDDPWWGTIPEGWNLRNLKSISTKSISYGVVKLFEPDENGVKILRCSDVKEGFIVEDNIRTITSSLSNEYKRTVLKSGDVVVNVRGTLGGCAVIPSHMEGYNIAREVALISPPIGEYDSRFLMYCILSNTFINYRDYNLAGSIYVGINMEMLAKFKCPIPPLEEQTEIASYLDAVCGEIDTLITQKEQIIESLNHYKKTLIYDAITGKRKVV